MSRTRRAVVAVTVASAVVGLTTTAVTVGTRGMAVDLGLSTVELGWVVNGYLVAAASLVLLGGRLGDTIGRRRTFDLGLAVFAVGSLVGAVAAGFWVLLGARVLQGVGAALVLPSSIEVVAEYAEPGAEGGGLRWRGLAYACAFAIGPLVGGVLTDWSSWRWIFVLDAVLVAVAWLVVRPLRRHAGRGRHSPTQDVAGAVLAAVLVALVVLLAERVATWQFASVRSSLVLVTVVVLGVLLVLHERRTEHPLMHPFVWQDRQVLGANVATVGASAGMLSLLYFFNLFAQSAATFDHAALSVLAALAPFVASMAVCAVFAHWFGHRVGPRGPVAFGLALMVVGFGILGTVTEATTEAQLYLPLAAAGVGAGITNASLTSVAVLHLPAGRMNEAAGWISLSRFLGSAMALAVGTATFLSVAASRRPGEVVVPDRDVDTFDLAAASLERDLSGPLAAAAGADTAERFARTMGVTAAVLAAVLVVSWWLLSSSGGPVPADTAAAEDGSQPA